MSQSSKINRRAKRRLYVQARLARRGTSGKDYAWLKAIWQQVRPSRIRR